MTSFGLLAGMHKARLVFPGLAEAEREVSRKWLAEHGMVGINGTPLRAS